MSESSGDTCPMSLFDIPGDILGMVISPEMIGRLGCAMMWRTCKSARRYILPRHMLHRSSIVNAGAADGYLDIIKWVTTIGGVCGYKSAELAAIGGHTETLRWLVDRGCKVRSRLMYLAVSAGHIETVGYLRTLTNTTYDMSRAAAARGDYAMVEYMLDSGFHLNTMQVCYAATAYNRLNILQLLRKKQYIL